MKRILVPTDFSPASHNAALYAAALARDYNASLVLMHAYVEPAAIGEVPAVLMATNALLRQDNEALLDREAFHLKALFNIPVTILAMPGFASVVVQVACTKEKPDLVIMGMKGLGRSGRWMGSTTVSTIRKNNCPVLVIPENYHYSGIKNITLASDLAEPLDINNYAILKEIVNKANASIHIITIKQRVLEGEPLAPNGTDAMERIFAGNEHSYSFLMDASVEEGIKEFIKDHPTDLVVMAAHKHNLLERMFTTIHSKEMSYKTQWPLLVLQDK